MNKLLRISSKKRKRWAIAPILLILLSAINSNALCYARNSASKALTAQTQDELIFQECRKALLELKSLREREAILKQEIEEYRKLTALQDERLELYKRSVVEYEKAIAAREKAEKAVEELKANYESQMRIAERQIANEKRKTRFWQIITGVVVVLALYGAASK